LDPTNRGAIKWAAVAYKRLGDYEKAIELWRRIPEDPDYEIEMAICFFLQKRYIEAGQFARKAKERGTTQLPHEVERLLSALSESDEKREKWRQKTDDLMRRFR
jgi:tetratricopeptide (TPR) repeat protein